MPGVPVEMKRMWEQEALPRLGKRAGGWVIVSRTLKTLGIGESQAEYELRDLTPSANPTVATYAKEDGVHVRITAKAERAEKARELMAAVEARAREILGDHVYGVDSESVADAVGALLERADITLGAMEYGTGGQLSSTLTTATVGAGAFLGGLLAHSPSLLAGFGVPLPSLTPSLPHSLTLSSDLAASMAQAARTTLHTRAGLAVVCSMEPQSSGEKPLGVVHAAVDLDGEVTSVTNRYSTTMRDLRRRAVLDAMDLMRRRLIANSD
jgi:nicotinamide-nucleotide amidase